MQGQVMGLAPRLGPQSVLLPSGYVGWQAFVEFYGLFKGRPADTDVGFLPYAEPSAKQSLSGSRVEGFRVKGLGFRV